MALKREELLELKKALTENNMNFSTFITAMYFIAKNPAAMEELIAIEKKEAKTEQDLQKIEDLERLYQKFANDLNAL